MTAPAAPLRRRRRHDLHQSDSTKARVSLAFACLWPLVALFFLTGSRTSPTSKPDGPVDNDSSTSTEKIRNLLDRVDILGYGPTHPRVAVVLVGDDRDKMISSVESVFSNTDLNRLFLVCAVMDGVESDPKLVRKMNEIDQGAVPHWHGLRPDLNKGEDSGEDEPHGKKVHVLFSPTKQGLVASRNDAVDFVQLLDKKHVKAGLKSPQEDLILLLMEPGTKLVSRKWLTSVSSALVVPPPLLPMGMEEDTTVAMKLSNAVSFAVEGSGIVKKALSFDFQFQPIWTDPSVTDMALSNGISFPTPALPGLATALRLETYVNLPAQDESLTQTWEANLDLALNLWLCADGIDVLTDTTVSPPLDYDATKSFKFSPKEAARFAAVWMDAESAANAFETLIEHHRNLTRLEWDTMVANWQLSDGFPSGLQSKCRPFSWYAQAINNNLVTPEPKAKTDPEQDQTAKAQVADANVEKKDVDLPAESLPVPNVDNEHEDSGDGGIPPPRMDLRLPSKPLDPKHLELISQAKPVDLAYVDVSGGHKEHPHKGARDADGNWGYIHDETALRRNPPKFEFDNLEVGCKRRDDHHKMLTQKVFVDMEAHEAAEKSGRKRDKIFCLVYTIDSGHPRIPAIRETWGPKCDGFMVGSNKTDPSIGAVNIDHEGKEEYDNIWQKVRSMWSYVYDYYYEKYDWFHIGGDDLFLIVENLRLYLESEEIKTAQNGGIYLPNGDETAQTPLFLGRRFAYMGDMNDIFISGGSGYTMNKAALKALVVDGFPNYFPHAHTFSEDTMVAKIFRKMGIVPYDTKDENGGERYMPFQPGHHYSYRPPADPNKDWYMKYSIDIKYGLDHCAARSVAFHYVKGPSMKRFFAILYHKCPPGTLD